MKNYSTKNFINIMETYLDFNQKYKSLIERERETTCIINRERERERERERDIK
jgi:chloramphenicol O-acetyltransferase